MLDGRVIISVRIHKMHDAIMFCIMAAYQNGKDFLHILEGYSAMIATSPLLLAAATC